MAEQKSKNYDYLFKLVLVGDACVGKSTIMSRFGEQTFIQYNLSTIGVDFRSRTVDIDDKKVKLQVWDTAHQERFREIVRTYYRGAHGMMIVYDITNEDTFTNAMNVWMKHVDENTGSSTIKMMVGNKCDLQEPQRVISRERGQLVADDHGAMFSEVSAKSGYNIDQTFIDIACAIYNKII